jgi:hypothetical protein
LTQQQLLDLGIQRNRAPGQTAMHELLCRLPASDVEKALGDWIGELAALEPSRQMVSRPRHFSLSLSQNRT